MNVPSAQNSPNAQPARAGQDRRGLLGALAIDLVCVLVFVVLGRAEHDRAASLLGSLGTAWPFVVALLVAVPLYRPPRAPLRTGVPVWLCVALIGLLLRGIAGGGLALPFVLVTLGVLGTLLIGWRGVAALLRRVRSRR